MVQLSEITGALQKYVVAPAASFGLAGYVFDINGESAAQLSADITDHYTEGNVAIQDHIAIRPKRINLKGYVGELVYAPQGQSIRAVAKLAQKPSTVPAYLPPLSAGATQLQAALAGKQSFDFNGILNTTANIYSVVKNSLGALGNSKNQQNAYNYFKSLMETKTLMSIQTPWEFVTNMAIESISALQDEKSIFVTDFSITLKEVRFAETTSLIISTKGSGSNTSATKTQSGDAAIQRNAPVNLGTTQGSSISDFINSIATAF